MPLKIIHRLVAAMLIVSFAGCATGRDMTSKYYLPEWENQVVNVPNPSETSGGYWAARAASKSANFIGRTLLIPFAVLGNVVANVYYISTWPIRMPLRGDKRLIVWHPLFDIGTDVGSDFYSKEWNRDLA